MKKIVLLLIAIAVCGTLSAHAFIITDESQNPTNVIPYTGTGSQDPNDQTPAPSDPAGEPPIDLTGQLPVITTQSTINCHRPPDPAINTEIPLLPEPGPFIPSDPFQTMDIDGNGFPDIVLTEGIVLVDVDGDGMYDLDYPVDVVGIPDVDGNEADMNGDGIPDIVIADESVVLIDLDFDGDFDISFPVY